MGPIMPSISVLSLHRLLGWCFEYHM